MVLEASGAKGNNHLSFTVYTLEFPSTMLQWYWCVNGALDLDAADLNMLH